MDATADKLSPAQTEDGEEFDVVKAAMRLFEASYEREKHNIDEGYDDLRVLAGEQWPEEIKRQREGEDRPCETINQMGQFVRQVTGDMRQSRPSIKVVPVDDSATEHSADAIGGVIRYIENRSDAASIYTQAADGQVACGAGAWRIITEYASESTFNQEIRIAPIEDALAVFWDEDSVLPTREDAMEVVIPIDMAHAKFKRLYPNAKAVDFASADAGMKASGWLTEDKIRLGEYWWKEPTKKLLALMMDGSVRDLTDKTQQDLQAILPEIALGPDGNPRIEEREAFKVRRALVTATEIVEESEDWPGSYFPIIWVPGEEIRIERKLVRHGVIRFAKPVQRIYNYAISADIEVTALQPKSPFIGTELNFKKYEDVWGSANRKNHAYLPFTPDPLNGGQQPSRVQPPVSSQGINTTIERSQRDFYSVTGIYPASLGAKSNETSGKAVIARERQGDTGTYVYPDNWTRAIRYTAKVLIDLIPKIYDTARVLRIVGEDGKVERVAINQHIVPRLPNGAPQVDQNGQPMRVFVDVTSGAYDIATKVGPSYATKREEARDGMQTLMQSNPQITPLIGDLYAKAQDWPMAEEIGERLELLLPAPIRQLKAQKDGKPPAADMQPPPPSPEQQAAMQMEMAGKQADLAEKQSNARAAEASARKAEADAQAAEVKLERELMTPPGGTQPEVGTALEGMARSIIELRMMIGGVMQAIQPPPAQQQPAPEPPMFDPPPPMDQPPSDMQPPPGGFFNGEAP